MIRSASPTRVVVLSGSLTFGVTLAILWSRLVHTFPSMVDDWSAIANGPDQLREVLRLGMPEEKRYRPGFVMWNVLQWHTFGGPGHLAVPLVWGLVRIGTLAFGLAAFAMLLIARHRLGQWQRLTLVTGTALVAVTLPALAPDLARYGPQEALLVGCLALGSALLVPELDRMLGGVSLGARGWAVVIAGLVVWIFGVLQKETSLCLFALGPFLVPSLKGQLPRFGAASRSARRAIATVLCLAMLPFLPMLCRTIQLSLADEKIYGAEVHRGRSLLDEIWRQLSPVGYMVGSDLVLILVYGAGAAVLATVVLRRTDWIALGLLVTALVYVAFTAQTGTVVSRYYLPPLVLAAFALCRASATLGGRTALAAGLVLVVIAASWVRSAQSWVDVWVADQRVQEAVVREVAARETGGCPVGVAGLNLEFVAAVPVLVPLAHERARGCTRGLRFVVTLDAYAPGDATPPDDPVLAACKPVTQPEWENAIATIRRCGQ